MAENLYIRPITVGTMGEGPNLNLLGAGSTNRVFLLGHADLPLNDPYLVLDIQEAINKFNGDVSSPLFRSLLEAFYSGAKDIWLMAVAPMSEYQRDVSLRDLNYYATYNDRLQIAYTMLEEWDLPQFVVPIEAPFFDAKGVDFLTPLSDHCVRGYITTGAIRLGMLGTITGPLTDQAVESMIALVARLSLKDWDAFESQPLTWDNVLSQQWGANADRQALSNKYWDGLGSTWDGLAAEQWIGGANSRDLSSDGKFVSVIVGEGVFSNKENPTAYSGSLNIVAACQLAAMAMNASLTYTKFLNVLTNVGTITDSQISRLTNAKLNPVARTTKGERGKTFESVVLTDNTLGITGTDFWSITQVRLVMHVIEDVRRIGNRYLGLVGFGQFKADLQDYFVRLVTNNIIRGYSLDVSQSPTDRTTIIVNISVTPYFGVRQLLFAVQVGP